MLRLSRFIRHGLLLLVATSILLSGCAMVSVRSVPPSEFISLKRGDIMSTGKLSANTSESLAVVGLDPAQCTALTQHCVATLAKSSALPTERKLSALAELWLQQALGYTPEPSPNHPDPRLHAWLEAARHAYAYLFFTERHPGQRAFEDRQIQMLDTYNYATQETARSLFTFQRQQAQAGLRPAQIEQAMANTGWHLSADTSALRLPHSAPAAIAELLPASELRFDGLRSSYRRDGFGAELVAISSQQHQANQPYSAMSAAAVTVVLRFEGNDLSSVLNTRSATALIYNPYRDAAISILEQEVPLAANFTAGYGLWLARSNFSQQSIRTLLGGTEALDAPHVYLMQPYDPSKRIILMIHGLASSPEAWVNLANEILGDETLRQHFQVWQVYYPTNVSITINRAAISQAIQETLAAVDPEGEDRARCGMILIGHSMGGLLSRLLVSSSGNALWDAFTERYQVQNQNITDYQDSIAPLAQFTPLPGVGRVIFLAAPHRGTEIASLSVVHWLSRLIHLPLTLINGLEHTLANLTGASQQSGFEMPKLATGVDHLDAKHPFVKLAAELPIQAELPYHSIIARTDPTVDILESDDGLVPYWSAHLPGATSEIIITSGHSVQETPEAILEIRRILHHDLTETSSLSCD